MRSTPFARANAMMSAIAGILAISQGISAQAQIDALGPYKSRGKGEGGGNRKAPGARMANIRAARKTRNVRRHRAALRG